MMRIALGGGCHWCTEAVFQSLKGVEKVDQGYVASVGENQAFSEAVIVYFNTKVIALKTIIEIHLYTHKSTSNHSMRGKYRSAVYVFSEKQKQDAKLIIKTFQNDFDNLLITQVLDFAAFEASREAIQNYYYKNPKKPFCESFINPKLQLLLKQFLIHTDQDKIKNYVLLL
ncbi:peptide-methionine (S)-S-oxide reductase [Mariniflexile ostreae]|uniref:peptide-methionine (S)-S-oxide reductase n=1 Tax=Mariniflexile ostreae TaxID=1520892 RepID=A0ABV5FDL6_9FLAO